MPKIIDKIFYIRTTKPYFGQMRYGIADRKHYQNFVLIKWNRYKHIYPDLCLFPNENMVAITEEEYLMASVMES